MKDLGLLSYFLGLEISQDSSGYFLRQTNYTSDLLARAGLTDCKTATTSVDSQTRLIPLEGSLLSDATLYCQLVGSLVYLTVTRQDIAYAIHIVSQFMVVSHSPHYDALIRICAISKALYFMVFSSPPSILYISILFLIKKQPLVARSSTEVEYWVLVDTTQELAWLRWPFFDMGVSHSAATNLYCNN
ncbi:uncharacterized protein LOC114285462 [Camellia sinensis]|uniref:uncharacterized protein LOC114285462 n=1 Tax=Camellia sinensis TaxID=4442 RepID=UPI0010365F66|nr:uncharacterized protein LOC114285462 [Camellia sinensis]